VNNAVAQDALSHQPSPTGRPAEEHPAVRKGRTWESSVSSGQQVHRGQELLRVLDCDRPVVTALVSEAVYNRLQVGSPARFLPHGDRQELLGEITRFTRVSRSSLAIQPSTASGETYHVTVSMPKLAEGESCLIGRTGRLKFDSGPPETAALHSRRPGSRA
jgi:hypothetical protein